MTTLAAAVDAQAKTIITDGPSVRIMPFLAMIGEEVVLVTGGAKAIDATPYPDPTSYRWQVVRGFDGTAPSDHEQGDEVLDVVAGVQSSIAPETATVDPRPSDGHLTITVTSDDDPPTGGTLPLIVTIDGVANVIDVPFDDDGTALVAALDLLGIAAEADAGLLPEEPLEIVIPAAEYAGRTLAFALGESELTGGTDVEAELDPDGSDGRAQRPLPLALTIVIYDSGNLWLLAGCQALGEWVMLWSND